MPLSNPSKSICIQIFELNAIYWKFCVQMDHIHYHTNMFNPLLHIGHHSVRMAKISILK